jgi:uncharacterized protein (TIGR03435 family)
MASRFTLTVLTLVLSCAAAAQSFDVVSIKPAADDVTGIAITPRRSGNRVTYVTEVRMIFYYAYRVAPYQVSGDFPAGVFDIAAIVDGSPTDDDLRRMFQKLLEDRFHLKLHTETRQMRAYELVVGKDGPRLKPAEDGEVLFDGRAAPEGVGAYATRAGPRLVGRRASMTQLAESLARSLQSPVVDRTGVTGTFDFNVAFSKESENLAAETASDPARAPTLPIAIQEQLGLKLQAGKAPAQILVIDHIERPTSN